MHHICLDTNTWIYLANGTEPVKLLHYIETEVKKNNIKIILPELVVNEWIANKENAVRQGTLKHFHDVEIALNKLSKLIGDNSDKDFLSFLLDEREEDKEIEDFRGFIANYKAKRTDIETAVTRNITLIEDLFANHAISIPIGNDIYIKSGQYAVSKKAPFKKKNSFADALILFSFLNYVEKQGIEGAMFISYNTEDFCEKKENQTNLHTDLIPEFDSTKSTFHKLLAKALKTIEEDIITQEELEFIEEMQEEYDGWNEDIIYCENCIGNHNRPSEVIFRYSSQIDDQRVEKFDPDQMELEFEEKYPKIRLTATTSISVGHCEYCSTEYFKCVDCLDINLMWEGYYDDHVYCEGCGLKYLINREFDNEHLESTEFIIPKKYHICSICGTELEEGTIGNNCEDCKESYANPVE